VEGALLSRLRFAACLSDLNNAIGGAIRIKVNITRRNAINLDLTRIQPGVAREILLLLLIFIVMRAIDFDGEFGPRAIEVEYEWANRMLAPKIET